MRDIDLIWGVILRVKCGKREVFKVFYYVNRFKMGFRLEIGDKFVWYIIKRFYLNFVDVE